MISHQKAMFEQCHQCAVAGFLCLNGIEQGVTVENLVAHLSLSHRGVIEVLQYPIFCNGLKSDKKHSWVKDVEQCQGYSCCLYHLRPVQGDDGRKAEAHNYRSLEDLGAIRRTLRRRKTTVESL